MPDKRPGIDVYGGHRFGLVDNQIATGFQFYFAFQRSLNFVFDIKEIENRLASGVMLQLAGHLGNVLRGKLQQCFVSQAGVNANAVQFGVGEITQNTLRQRQNGQSNQKIAFASAFLLYEGEPTQDDQKSFLQDSAAVQPLNKELRRAFIVDMASSTDFAGGLIDLTWWMLPPFVLLGLALAVLLVQRRWMLFFAAGTFFARIPLVFLTAPDTYFMYYLTPFIAVFAVAAAAVLFAALNRKLISDRIRG